MALSACCSCACCGEVGHWEIDTVMGKLARHCAKDAVARCVELIDRHAPMVDTITADNGTEFHS